MTVAVVLIFVGGVAAIAVPNLTRAMQRSRQKRTMADMRTIATAWEGRATDINSYSLGPRPVTIAELARVLEPKYVRHLPRVDGWGSEFQVSLANDQTYAIRSLGSDHQRDANPNLSGPMNDFAADIVFSNGVFTRYPEEAG